MTTDAYKKQAAAEAIKLVEPGMKLGLGTGSTAAHFIDLLGAKVAAGLDVVCVPTSEATRAHAQRLGIRLTTLDEEPYLDLTVDGADELDASLRLIKGGGGALLREKIVATASGRMVVIADDSKLVEALGRYPLPIETVEFGATSTRLLIEALAADAGCFGELSLRRSPDGRPFKSDSGNVIFDCAFNHISDPEGLAALLEMIPGVVEHGLFIDIADKAIVAGPRGVQVIDSSNDSE